MRELPAAAIRRDRSGCFGVMAPPPRRAARKADYRAGTVTVLASKVASPLCEGTAHDGRAFKRAAPCAGRPRRWANRLNFTGAADESSRTTCAEPQSGVAQAIATRRP